MKDTRTVRLAGDGWCPYYLSRANISAVAAEMIEAE